MADTPTLESVATEALRYFKRGKRENGDEYYKVADDAPSWIHSTEDDREESLVWKGHGDGEYLPDDHRYEFIVQALSALSDGDEDGDGLEPDVYNSGLYAWLSSHGSRAGYVDEAASDAGGFTSIADAIGAGQLTEKREVFEAVKAAIEARIEALEAEDEDEDEDEESGA